MIGAKANPPPPPPQLWTSCPNPRPVTSTQCVACYLHTILPLERTCWKQFVVQWGDCKNLELCLSIGLWLLLLLLLLKETHPDSLNWHGKGFDKVWKDGLKLKQRLWGVIGCIYKWIDRYLKNRRVRVQIQHPQSRPHDLKQGKRDWVLSPTFSVVFMKNILQWLPKVWKEPYMQVTLLSGAAKNTCLLPTRGWYRFYFQTFFFTGFGVEKPV